MKIGFLGKQNAFALEMLRRLRCEHPDDQFSSWQPGEKAPSTELEVILAFGKVESKEIEAQTRLGLIQMASAGYEGVDVGAATEAGVWVGSAPTKRQATASRWRSLRCSLCLRCHVGSTKNWP